jgi:hypothetical protein
MLNPNQIEQAYQLFINDINKWVPDGIIDVDLFLLKELGLLNQNENDEKILQSQFPFYFHVVETDDKVTLFNNQFVVWIVPQMLDGIPTTVTLISLIDHNQNLNPEMAFSTAGVYNTPKCVLKVLRYYLTEVIDTESVIDSFDSAEGT